MSDKPTILIIEDEENILEAERMILEDDYNVYTALDGEEGHKKAHEINPDLIVLDLMLPKRGGYDLAFHFRQDEQLKDTKILMLTALGKEIDRDKGKMVGANHYMTKPFEPEDLQSKVKELLDAKHNNPR